MSTAKQIAANRRNARKSCGAKTEAGKAIVSQNRTIHGLTGKFYVMPCENQADYDALLDALIADEKPVGVSETQLVVKMAEHTWLAKRAVRLQENCFSMEPTDAALKAEGHQTISIRCDLLDIHIRYHATHDRAYRRASQELIQRKNARLKAEIGFESQKRAQAAERRREAAENRRVERHLAAVALDKKRRELADLKIVNAAATAANHFNGVLPPQIATQIGT